MCIKIKKINIPSPCNGQFKTKYNNIVVNI